MEKTLDTTPFFAGAENSEERRAIYREHEELITFVIGVTMQIMHGAIHGILAQDVTSSGDPELAKLTHEDKLAIALEFVCRAHMRSDIHRWMAQNMCGQTDVGPVDMEHEIVQMSAKKPDPSKELVERLLKQLGLPPGTSVEISTIKL